MSDNRKRIGWIDMAKGYGIILVIIGHLSTPYITTFIYTFHIPLFFFLSGYVFNGNKGFKDFIVSKIKRLLVPYFCLSVPMILFLCLYDNSDISLWNKFCSESLRFLIQERHTTLWFIACLFILNLLYYMLVKYINNKFLILFVVSFITIIGILLMRLNAKALPWSIDICLVVLPYMYIGNFFKEKDIFERYINGHNIILFISIILTFVIGGFNYYISGRKVDLFYGRLCIEPLTYIAAFSGLIMIVIISGFFSSAIIKYIGKNSLIYFAWHINIVIPLIRILYAKLDLFNNVNKLSQIIFRDLTTLFITLIMLTVINELICRSKLKFILGK